MAGMAREQMSDERLCWLAVRDRLPGQAGGLQALAAVVPLVVLVALGYLAAGGAGAFFGAILGCVGALVVTRWYGRLRDRQRQAYSFAVHDTVADLSPAERDHLRQTGQVPDWFLDRVVQRRRSTAR